MVVMTSMSEVVIVERGGTSGTSGWGNGYVDLNEGHVLFGKSYNYLHDNYNIYVHGGLTFSELVNGKWRIGFDTAHMGDNKESCPKEYVLSEAYNLKKTIDDIHNNSTLGKLINLVPG